MYPASTDDEKGTWSMNEILRMEHISKQFGDFYANKDINFDVLKGEVHTLLGENGAGKSTLMNVLIGLYQPTAGKITFDGKVLFDSGEQYGENGKMIVDANGKEVRGAKRGYDVLGNRRTGSGTGDDTPMWPIAVLVISAVGMAALVEMKRRKDKNDEIK